MTRFPILLLAAAAIAGGSGLSGCATKEYVDKSIAVVNTRIDGVESMAQDGVRRADAANAAANAAAAAARSASGSAQSAAASAQAAATDARNANQRLDTLGPRVDSVEQRMTTATTTAPTTKRRPRN